MCVNTRDIFVYTSLRVDAIDLLCLFNNTETTLHTLANATKLNNRVAGECLELRKSNDVIKGRNATQSRDGPDEKEKKRESLDTFEGIFERRYLPCTFPNTSNSTDTRGSRQRGSSAAIPLEFQRGISRSPNESSDNRALEESVSSGDEEDVHQARNPISQRVTLDRRHYCSVAMLHPSPRLTLLTDSCCTTASSRLLK